LPILDDRYELAGPIGRGSTGTVWEAWDRVAAEIVAVKVLDPSALAHPRAHRRFLREVETARVLSHAHSVEVRAHGTTPEGGAYLVMERLVGMTLAARLRESGPLDQSRAIAIVSQVLEAVSAAHRLGIVHRDLKPGNVMLVEHEGDIDFVKVLDFGLAKAIERDARGPSSDGELPLELGSLTTHEGQICGTPEYMAPEQARGEVIDARADLYAVAVMLFHAVTGRLPFTGPSPLAIVSLHLTAPPPRPSLLRPDLGIFPPLERLILRGLAKDRSERPSSAEVFRADLLQIERDLSRSKPPWQSQSSFPIEGDTVSLAPSSSDQGAAPGTRAAVALGLATLVLGGASLAMWKDAHRASARALEDAAPPPALVTTAARAVVPERPSAPAPTTSASVEPFPSKISREDVRPRERQKLPRPVGLLEQASTALMQGRIDEACALGQTAAAGTPGSPAVWKFLGQCYMRLGERERAVVYYRRYLELAPDSSDALFVRQMIE
jgi:serine/threonine protein kinase